MVLPSLARLSDAKRKLEGSEDGGDEGSSKAAKDTDAKRLLEILHALPSMSIARAAESEPDWVYALSNDQFDMLLSMRLYTGSLYRLMAAVLSPNHERDVQSSTERTMEAVSKLRDASSDRSSILLYVALVNARRRMATREPSPLFVEELGETVHVDVPEREFRRLVAILLTDYRAYPRPVGVGDAMLDKFTQRASGSGQFWNELANSASWANRGPLQIADASVRELWAAIRHTALALRTLILESHVVNHYPLPVYRGMKGDARIEELDNSFVSVSRAEGVSRLFTTSYELTAPDQCCMMRISLLGMTPYLDVDKALETANGWGFNIGEQEFILPPGLKWQLESKERDKQPAAFPKEIVDRYNGDEVSYSVNYYATGPPEQ